MSENSNPSIYEYSLDPSFVKIVQQPYDLFTIVSTDGVEVLRISSEGKFYINGKEVTSEKEILDSLISWMQTGEQRLTTATQMNEELERENSRLREELGIQKNIRNKAW